MKHDFHERKERRIENAIKQAEKNRSQAEQRFKAADQISKITQGEPIKVGHHSEGRHRRDLQRMDDAMHASVVHARKADYYEGKADAIENNRSISSDDPDALVKLREKLEILIKRQEMMKSVNKTIAKGDKEAFLALPGGTEMLWEQYNKGDYMGRKGFANYELSNNNANINRIRKRIKQMEQQEGRTEKEENVKGVRYVENKDANRVQLIFPGKPSEEVRKKLKTYGFNWSPSEGAWQRQLNGSGIYNAQAFLEGYVEE